MRRFLNNKNPKFHTILGQELQPVREAHTRTMSSASAAINLYKNVESKSIITAVGQSEFNKVQTLQIQECIRSLMIDIRHFIPV